MRQGVQGLAVQVREERIVRAAEMVIAAERVVFFTGAGVSTESGIPDFRSPGGLWSRFDQEDFTIDRYLTSPEARRKHWRFLMNGGLFQDSSPNAAHWAIAALESLGKLACIITQNIDNLHQRAGNHPDRVYELHGNMRQIRCLKCGMRFPLEKISHRVEVAQGMPVCERCGGILKPDVIFFGEALPEATLREASLRARECNLMIVVGSSLVVYPAAVMPVLAKEAGAKLVIINLSPTPMDASADLVIHASAGEVLESLVEEVRWRLPG